MKKYLVIDGGGTFVKHAVMAEDGSILAKGKYDTPCEDRELFLAKITELYEADRDISGIALSMPGVIDIEKGFMHNAGAIHCCEQTYICELISERCGGLPVAVENDGKAAARAEMISGALKDCRSGVVIGLGTGIAGTVFIDRKILRGNSLFAGELSYNYRHNNRLFDEEQIPDRDLRLQRYSSLCTPGGIVHGYMELSGAEGLTAKDCPSVFAKMEAGDAAAFAAIRNAARDLAMLVFNIQCVVDPEAFAIGGGLSAQDVYIEMVREAVKRYVPAYSKVCPTPVVRACAYRNDANLLGALYRFQDEYVLES